MVDDRHVVVLVTDDFADAEAQAVAAEWPTVRARFEAWRDGRAGVFAPGRVQITRVARGVFVAVLRPPVGEGVAEVAAFCAGRRLPARILGDAADVGEILAVAGVRVLVDEVDEQPTDAAVVPVRTLRAAGVDDLSSGTCRIQPVDVGHPVDHLVEDEEGALAVGRTRVTLVAVSATRSLAHPAPERPCQVAGGSRTLLYTDDTVFERVGGDWTRRRLPASGVQVVAAGVDELLAVEPTGAAWTFRLAWEPAPAVGHAPGRLHVLDGRVSWIPETGPIEVLGSGRWWTGATPSTRVHGVPVHTGAGWTSCSHSHVRGVFVALEGPATGVVVASADAPWLLADAWYVLDELADRWVQVAPLPGPVDDAVVLADGSVLLRSGPGLWRMHAGRTQITVPLGTTLELAAGLADALSERGWTPEGLSVEELAAHLDQPTLADHLAAHGVVVDAQVRRVVEAFSDER
jgi:hypothetical protein